MSASPLRITGGSFCPNDLKALSKNIRCDEASVFITGAANCTVLWSMEGATQCQQSGSTGWGCCIPIDNFFPCTGISSCELEICDVKEVALQSFRAMYFFVSAQRICRRTRLQCRWRIPDKLRALNRTLSRMSGIWLTSC